MRVANRVRWVSIAWLMALWTPLLSGSPAFGESPAPAEDAEPRVSFGGRITLDSALGIPDGDLRKFRLEWREELDYDVAPETDVHAVIRLRADPAFDFGNSGGDNFPELTNYTSPLRIGDAVELELRELYLRTPIGQGVLTLGKQQIVWGVADGLKVLDVVNPMDLREFILDDFEDSRIPLWAANAQLPIKDWELQLLWIPDPSYHVVPRLGSQFEVTYGVPDPPPLLSVHLEDARRPDDPFTGSDAGFRLSTFKKGWDITFNYLYHRDDVPALPRRLGITANGPAVIVKPRYERGHVIGGTFSRAVGKATVRAEYALFLDRPYSTRGFRHGGVALVDEASYVVGVDWFALGQTFFSVQLFQNWTLDPPSGLLRDSLQTYGTALVQKRLLRDQLTLELFLIQSFNTLEGLVRPRVSYEVNDDIGIYAGADIFYGSREDLFGQYHESDRFTLGVQWTF